MTQHEDWRESHNSLWHWHRKKSRRSDDMEETKKEENLTKRWKKTYLSCTDTEFETRMAERTSHRPLAIHSSLPIHHLTQSTSAPLDPTSESRLASFPSPTWNPHRLQSTSYQARRISMPGCLSSIRRSLVHVCCWYQPVPCQERSIVSLTRSSLTSQVRHTIRTRRTPCMLRQRWERMNLSARNPNHQVILSLQSRRATKTFFNQDVPRRLTFSNSV